MAVSATDDPVIVTITENGAKGDAGTNGTDGAGFNQVRKALIDNPLSWLYSKNHLVRVLKNLLTVTRTTSGAYTDIYGVAQVAAVDTPREEVKGWFLNGDEVHTFQVLDNIPDPNNGFSVVFRVGSYSESAPSQDIISIPATAGTLLTIGTDGSGNWLATLQGSDAIEYQATTVVSATSAVDQTVVVNYDGVTGVIDLYINDSLAGTATLVTGDTATIDTDETVVTIDGDFDINIKGLRFFDFPLNSEEITYLN